MITMEVLHPGVISIVMNLLTLAYIVGAYSARINRLEADIVSANIHINRLLDLHAEMATIQTELKSVNQTLLRFEKYFMDGAPNA
jgi:hypothetical protein